MSLKKHKIIKDLQETNLDQSQHELWADIIVNTEKKLKKEAKDRINVNGNILGNDCTLDGSVIHNSKKLCWYVFKEENNKIKTVNIFQMIDQIQLRKIFKKAENFNAFAHDLKSMLMYQFWSRSQHEIIITDLFQGISKLEAQRIADNISDIKYRESVNLDISRKVDIYTQIMINWPQFLNYTWSFLKRTLKK